MFYSEDPDKAFRLGDILQGFVFASTKIESPSSLSNYSIDVSIPEYAVILTPCCSISEKVITLTPLLPLRGAFFKNPYFVEDLTRLNRLISPENSLPPVDWGRLPPEEKQKRLAEGEAYAFVDLFIYGNHDLLPSYAISRKEGNIDTNCYMIDFKKTYHINCDKILSPKQVPLEAKYLQLSIGTRKELRDKLTNYIQRIPDEDKDYL